jgi:hypothetical protein
MRIAGIYSNLNEHRKSLSLHISACELMQQTGRIANLGACYAKIGSEFMYFEELEKALEFHKRALDCFSQVHEPTHVNITVEKRVIGSLEWRINVD